MKWKIWSKDKAEQPPSQARPKQLPKAKEIPEIVGRHLVVEKKEDPDWVWELKAVVRPKETDPDALDVRIFDPERAVAFGVRVQDYTTLDEHPHLIVYEGWYSKKQNKVQITHTAHETV